MDYQCATTSSKDEPYERLLTYTLHKWSSFSSNFHPSNIQFDHPCDQSSRWSSDSNYPPQYLMLKLPQPAVVTAITFGKYEKTHVCNLRKFKVLGGLSEETAIELLCEGLKNDCRKEMFELNHELYGKEFPCRYIKIVPLMSWGPSFNFSIWHVSLHGIDDQTYVRPRLKWFNNFREQEAIRLCLKHFREKNYTESFDALESQSKVVLEEPMITNLHQALVVKGDFDRVENILENSAKDGLFHEYMNKKNYQAKWTRIIPLTEDGLESCDRPGMRGGHQMCIDEENQIIFLLGGWDGTKDLSDFWVYNIQIERWHCISADTKADGGPSARSCHKICFDSKRRHLYILGRYLESDDRRQLELKSDLYRYELDCGLWHHLTDDTASTGGPYLIFDHQMQYDRITDTIYVFGGRILTSIHDDNTFDPSFSGLFSYHVETKVWTKLKGDCSGTSISDQLRARSGHSMLIDGEKRLLYILAGQRGKDNYLSDFSSYNIDTGEINYFSSRNKKDIPSAGYTQRSTIDVTKQEIYVLAGLSKDKERKDESIPNAFWVYDINSKKWSCIYKNEHTGLQYWNKMNNVEPQPRFAHQLVYDSTNKVHYLFGGNPGSSGTIKVRLDDFWKLKLERTTVDDLLRQCKYEIRKLRYKELINDNPVEALSFLQERVYELVDSSIEEEREEFEALASSLFALPSPVTGSDEETSVNNDHASKASKLQRVYKARTSVFNHLMLLYPPRMVQPKENLTDLINL